MRSEGQELFQKFLPESMRLKLTPTQTFTIISLLLIASIVVATSYTQSAFFRQSVIDRQSLIVSEMVGALASQLSVSDIEHYDQPEAKMHLTRSFGVLKNISGVLRIKVFNRDETIVWSDQPQLIGTKITDNRSDLEGAFKGGDVHAVFSATERSIPDIEGLPHSPLIEFYVPFALSEPRVDGTFEKGVLSLYRSPDALNDTIWNGMVLLWLVTGVGGVIMFAALYKLFHAVYRQQLEAESQFARLSADHERMIQVEKLSAMGQMVGEIAHQLNNPLVGVINLAQLAEREVENPQRVKELLAEVRKAGEHCRHFVQRMLRFTKVAHSEPRVTEMKGLAHETIAFFQQSVGHHTTVTLDAPEQDLMLRVDPVLMRHALFNLIHNAAQADPRGPVLVRISTESLKGVAGCRLDVCDGGPGIDASNAEQLFTPFFTTKEDGTGLGLSVAQHIALLHGGLIRAENRSTGGACFSIWLPAGKEPHEG